jgi:hypothetical protein
MEEKRLQRCALVEAAPSAATAPACGTVSLLLGSAASALLAFASVLGGLPGGVLGGATWPECPGWGGPSHQRASVYIEHRSESCFKSTLSTPPPPPKKKWLTG